MEEAEADLDPREFLLVIDASAFDGGRTEEGATSREKAPAPMAERFEEIDRDGDGRITLEELRDYLR